MKNLHYPIICFKKGDIMIYGFKNDESFTTADKKLTESGVFNNLKIIDSSGNSYVVINTKILGWATPFWGFSLKQTGRLIKVDFVLESEGKVAFNELKAELLYRINNAEYFKRTFNGSELEKKISESKTFDQLANIW